MDDFVNAQEMSLEDDTGFFEKAIFGFWETLVSDDLAEDGLGGEFFGFEKSVGFCEFFGKSSYRIVLGGWAYELG